MTISATAAVALRADGTAEAFVELVTLEHADLAAPIRLANMATPGGAIVSRGNTFYAYPFDVTFPERNEQQPFGAANVRIANVPVQDGSYEPSIVALLRSIRGRARVRFEVVRLSDPDTVEMSTTRLRLTSVSYDLAAIDGVLELPNYATRRAGRRFTPDRYPHLLPF